MHKIAALLMSAVLLVLSMSVVASATRPTVPCQPQEGHYTEWVNDGEPIEVEPDIGTPPVRELERWIFVGTKEVLLEDGWEEEVFDHWQRYSWTGGPQWQGSDEGFPPPFPDEGWQPNVEGDPHDRGVEGAYFMSHGNSGNGDWFYLEAVTKIVVHPPTYQTLNIYQPQIREWVEPVTCPPVEEPCPGDKEPAQMCNPPITPVPNPPDDNERSVDEPKQDSPDANTAPASESYCSGTSLVTKVTKANGNTETSYEAGHPQCAVGSDNGPATVEGSTEEGL